VIEVASAATDLDLISYLTDQLSEVDPGCADAERGSVSGPGLIQSFSMGSAEASAWPLLAAP
jgi:hypothetical protein